MRAAKSQHHHTVVRPRPTVQAVTLQTACGLVGGVPKLATHLGVPAASIQRWLDGEKPPTKVFLDCVDIVLFHERHLGPTDAGKL